MAQASGTKTGSRHAPPVRRRRRGLEVGGLVIGILAGLGITLGWLISTRGQPPRPVVLQHPPARAGPRRTGRTGRIGRTGPGRAERAVGRLLESRQLCRLGRRRRGLGHPAELLAARLVLLRHLSRAGQPHRRFLASVRVHAQLAGRPDQDRDRQYVRHPDRRRSLPWPGPSGRRGPRGGATANRIRRVGRPVLGGGRHQDRRHDRQVLQPLPGRHRPVRAGRNGDRQLSASASSARPAARTSTAGWPGRT